MRRRNVTGASGRKAASALLASAAVLGAFVFWPSGATALSTGFDSQPVSLAARGGIGSFTPASADPQLAASLSLNALSHGQLFRFTPVHSLNRPNRSVTVAVRVNRDTAGAISVRKALAEVATAQPSGSIRIAPTAYNLGVSRGYKSFALPTELQKIEMPDLAALAPAKDNGEKKPGRLSSRIALDDGVKPGRNPRTFAGQGDYSVDVGTSYRLIGNLDVTAGLRYSSERDRLAPVTDATQDSQAVYVGTQFRF